VTVNHIDDSRLTFLKTNPPAIRNEGTDAGGCCLRRL
jgi:hypothetical protein